MLIWTLRCLGVLVPVVAFVAQESGVAAAVVSSSVTARSACACTPLWHCLARAAAPTGPCRQPPSAAVPQTYVQCCPRVSSTSAPIVNSVTTASASISSKPEDFEEAPRTPVPSSSQEVSSKEGQEGVDENSWAQCGRRGQPSHTTGIAAPHEWPWHAAILEEPEDRYVCGASLISATWLLSAAHCVVDYLGSTTSAPLKARLGELDVRSDNESPFPIQERRIAQMLPHPGFDARTLRHDAALLRLAAPANAAPNVAAVCLPSPPTTDIEGVGTVTSAEIPDDEDEEAECYVTGWGRKDEASSHSQVLKSVRVPLWRRRECDAALKPLLGSGYHLPEAALCAGAEGRDACDGDGGGPLVCRRGSRWAQVGIVSFGVGCGRRGSPGVYTSVTRLARWVATMTGAVLPTSFFPDGSSSTPRSFPPDAVDERPSAATTLRTTLRPRPPYPVQVISYNRNLNSGFRSLHVSDADERARQAVYTIRYGSPRNGFSDATVDTAPSPVEPILHGTTVSDLPLTTKLAFLPTVFRQPTETSATVPNELELVHVSTNPFHSPIPSSRSPSEKARRTEDRGSRGSARASNSRIPNARKWEVEDHQISTSTYRTITSSAYVRNDTNSTIHRGEPLKWGYGVVINHPPSQRNGTTERTTSATMLDGLNDTASPTAAHPPVAARPVHSTNSSSSYSIYRIYPSSSTRVSSSRKATPPPVRPPSKVAQNISSKRGGKALDPSDGEARSAGHTAGASSIEDIPTTVTSTSSTPRNAVQVATTVRVGTDDGPVMTDATTSGSGGAESSTTDNSVMEVTTTGYVATPPSSSDRLKTTAHDAAVIVDKPMSSSDSVWVTPRAPLLPTPVTSILVTPTNRPAPSAVIARGGRRHGQSRSRISWQTESETSWSSSNKAGPTPSSVRHAFHPGLRRFPADDEPDYDELQEAAPPVPHIVRSRPRSRAPPPAILAVHGDEVSKSSRTRSRSRPQQTHTQRSGRRNSRLEKSQQLPVASPSTADPFTKTRSSSESWFTGLPLSTVTPSAFASSGASSLRLVEEEESIAGRLLNVRLSKAPGITTPSTSSEDDVLTNRAKNEPVLRSLSAENLDEGDVYAYLNAGRPSSASRRRTTATALTSSRRPRTGSRTGVWDS